MKKSDIQKMVSEEIASVMSILSQPHSQAVEDAEKYTQREPVEAAWEKVSATGNETVGVITDAEKIAKIVAIAKAAACKPPQMGMFEGKELQLNRISKGDLGKYKMYTTTPEGNVRKLDFVKNVNTGKPMYEAPTFAVPTRSTGEQANGVVKQNFEGKKNG